MGTENAINRERRSSFWGWPGPAQLYLILICAAIWAPISFFGGRSDFSMAMATAVAVCVGVAYQVLQGESGKWTPYVAWVVRLGAAITGYWLFIAAPTRTSRFLAVIIYAVVYVICDWTAWHRARRLRPTTI
jgi:hypothetical protein